MPPLVSYPFLVTREEAFILKEFLAAQAALKESAPVEKTPSPTEGPPTSI